MTNNEPDKKPNQEAIAGRDVEQVGRDKNITTTTSFNFWIPLFLFGVVAVGGLAWAVNFGWLANSGNPQQSSPQSGSNPTGKTIKP